MLVEVLVSLIETLQNNINGDWQVIVRIFVLRLSLYSHPYFCKSELDLEWDAFLEAEISARARTRLQRDPPDYKLSKDELIKATNFLVKQELQRISFKPRKIKAFLTEQEEDELKEQYMAPSPSIALLTEDLSCQSPSNTPLNISLDTPEIPRMTSEESIDIARTVQQKAATMAEMQKQISSLALRDSKTSPMDTTERPGGKPTTSKVSIFSLFDTGSSINYDIRIVEDLSSSYQGGDKKFFKARDYHELDVYLSVYRSGLDYLGTEAANKIRNRLHLYYVVGKVGWDKALRFFDEKELVENAQYIPQRDNIVVVQRPTQPKGRPPRSKSRNSRGPPSTRGKSRVRFS